MAIYTNVVDTIGRTPVIKLNRLSPIGVDIYVKYEATNPGGSVKDRLALAAVLDAERSGRLRPGDTIVECTSGNVGISLAMLAAARGYAFVAVMGDTFSIERRKLIRAFGGKVLLFHVPEMGSAGGNQWADDLAAEFGWFRPQQFANPANPAFHRETTGSEILLDFAGRRLDFFVTGFGTSGTLTGVGQMLRLARPDVRIVTYEPQNAPVLAGGDWTRHKLQGLSPNFVPEVMDRSVIDELHTVSEEEARSTALRLAREEGILAGISGGANVAMALRIAERSETGTVVLTMLPDSGERYLSSYLFEDINEESDDDWLTAKREHVRQPARTT